MKRKNKGHTAVIILGYLALLTIVMCMALLIAKWLQENAQSGVEDIAVNAGAEAPAPADHILTEEQLLQEQKLTMTQEELDAMLDAASANAVLEMENTMGEAVDQAAANARAEVLEGIRAGLETGDDSMVEVLRPFYPDDIVVVSNGKFHFVPINRNLKMNAFSDDNLNVLESGEYQYLENGQVISHKGIDVSSHQGTIDWQAVAADGVEFAFIRAAFRGYESGKLVEDSEFEDNIQGALAAGIHVGVYVYSQAINDQEALEEADLVMKKLAPYGTKIPIVYDVEKTGTSSGRMNQLTPEERTNITLLFCQTVENAGYTPMIYHNMEMAALMIDIETFEQYGKWFAYYNDDMYYPYEYGIWQYSDKGAVNGIKGDVDLNISFSAFWEE